MCGLNSLRLHLGLGLLLLLCACQAPIQPAEAAPGLPQPFRIPVAGTCRGLPEVPAPVAAEQIRCIGLLDDNLSFPRGLAVWQNQLLVVDKGTSLQQRERSSGAVYRYPAAGQPRQRLLSGLHNPSGIAVWQNRLAYVSTPTQVLRFDPAEPASQAEVVVDGLPTHGWHYLTGIHIHNSWLYVTVPSATDHCESAQGEVVYPCPESLLGHGTNAVPEAVPEAAQTAVIRRYRIDDQGNVSQRFHTVAWGLRDALAVISHPTKPLLYAADNGWDQVNLQNTGYQDASTPQDELNLIHLDRPQHFGWPYCFDLDQITPPYLPYAPACGNFTAPSLLLPAHSAPLGMAWMNNTLWINLHSSRSTGQRTVRVSVDADGNPTGPLEQMIHWDYSTHSPLGAGRPFGIVPYVDNTLVVSDDWNRALLLVVLKP